MKQKTMDIQKYLSIGWCPKIAHNVLALGAVADFGAKSCQVTTKADTRHNVELTTKTAIEPNACYQQPFNQIINF